MGYTVPSEVSASSSIKSPESVKHSRGFFMGGSLDSPMCDRSHRTIPYSLFMGYHLPFLYRSPAENPSDRDPAGESELIQTVVRLGESGRAPFLHTLG